MVGGGAIANIAQPAFTVLFVTIGPLDVAPLFIALTPGAAEAKRREFAVKGTMIAGLVLLAFAFGGSELMTLLGISFPAFRIAGGILLLLLAIDLVFAHRTGLSSITQTEEREAGREADISVFPLAIPLLAGPGAITAVVLLMGNQDDNAMGQVVVVAVLLLVLAITVALLFAAGALVRYLRVTGINVLTRVSGILLAALAAQFLLDGLRQSHLFG